MSTAVALLLLALPLVFCAGWWAGVRVANEQARIDAEAAGQQPTPEAVDLAQLRGRIAELATNQAVNVHGVPFIPLPTILEEPHDD